MNEGPEAGAQALVLNELLIASGLTTLDSQTSEKFEQYLGLLIRWNARMNLTAIREPKEIIHRHFVESIACAQALPPGVSTLLDFGSGGGFPGVPIALCRPEIQVTLAESQTKKAAFLNEVVRELKLGTRVFAGRAETLGEHFDCVALRAVDRMAQAVASGWKLTQERGWLAVLTTEAGWEELRRDWSLSGAVRKVPIAGSRKQLLVLVSKGYRA